MDLVKEDIWLVSVREENVEDRVKWRMMIILGNSLNNLDKAERGIFFHAFNHYFDLS